MTSHVQEYLDTGKFDMYGKKGADVIAKKIASDLRVRGAEAYADGKYIRTVNDYKVQISKNREDKWVAKASNSSNNTEGNSSMKDVLTNMSHKYKRRN